MKGLQSQHCWRKPRAFQWARRELLSKISQWVSRKNLDMEDGASGKACIPAVVWTLFPVVPLVWGVSLRMCSILLCIEKQINTLI